MKSSFLLFFFWGGGLGEILDKLIAPYHKIVILPGFYFILLPDCLGTHSAQIKHLSCFLLVVAIETEVPFLASSQPPYFPLALLMQWQTFHSK
jgi:hypothetical protein